MKMHNYTIYSNNEEYRSSNEELLNKASRGEQLTPKEKIRLKKLQENIRKTKLNKKK
jgi:hypothetical protein